MTTLSILKFTLPSFSGSPEVDDGILNCTINRPATLYQKEKVCKQILACITGYASGVEQAQYSSAATVLGLLPTALSMMATSTDDLLRVHSRFPVLALLMSFCNPSTISATISSSPEVVEPVHTARNPSLLKRLNHGFPIPFTQHRVSIPFWFHDLALHILAFACVIMIFWQAWILGVRGVIVYACWTAHNPITWVCVGGLSHVIRIITWRLTLGPLHSTSTSTSSSWLQWTPRWHFNLSSRTATHLILRHPRVARFLAIMFQIIGVMNYGFGTLQFSGFTLVGPFYAIRTFTLIGCSSLISRLIAIWLLEVYPDVKVVVSASDGGGGSGEEVGVLENFQLGKIDGGGSVYAMLGEERMVR